MIETIKKIQEAKRVLERPYPEDRRFIPGHEMAKAEASRELEKLNRQLVDDVASVAVPVYIAGPTAKQLALAMSELTEAAVVDVNGLYGEIVNSVDASMGRAREFGPSQYALVLRQVKNLASELGVPAMSLPKFGEPQFVADRDALTKLVHTYVNDLVGADLTVNYVKKVTGERAVDVLTEKVPVFPVFILNAPTNAQRELTKRLFKKNIEISLDSQTEVTEEAALNSLKLIKKTLKNNKD